MTSLFVAACKAFQYTPFTSIETRPTRLPAANKRRVLRMFNLADQYLQGTGGRDPDMMKAMMHGSTLCKSVGMPAALDHLFAKKQPKTLQKLALKNSKRY